MSNGDLSTTSRVFLVMRERREIDFRLVERERREEREWVNGEGMGEWRERERSGALEFMAFIWGKISRVDLKLLSISIFFKSATVKGGPRLIFLSFFL